MGRHKSAEAFSAANAKHWPGKKHPSSVGAEGVTGPSAGFFFFLLVGPEQVEM